WRPGVVVRHAAMLLAGGGTGNDSPAAVGLARVASMAQENQPAGPAAAQPLAGKGAVVTGGSRGIGRAVVERLRETAPRWSSATSATRGPLPRWSARSPRPAARRTPSGRIWPTPGGREAVLRGRATAGRLGHPGQQRG